MKKVYFYDTNALLNSLETVKERDGVFYLSSKTIEELEDIKVSGKKTEEVKYNARQAVRWLDENNDKFICVYPEVEIYNVIYGHELEVSNDTVIVATACFMSNKVESNEEFIFVSDDLLCKLVARTMGLKVEGIVERKEDDYCGYKVIDKQQEIADFYEKKQNDFGLLINEYLLIADDYGTIVDGWKWTKNGFVAVSYKGVKSSQLGDIKPKDFYQACVFDSMHNNKLTKIGGVAGTGKSLLSLGFLFQQLEKGKIDKIVIFCNMTQVRGSETLGLYKGDRDSKLLQSQIGNFLRSKLGSLEEVERLMGKFKSMFPSNKGEYDEVLNIYPMCDIRGVDLTGQKAGVLITEAQNVTVDLMKLCIQRLGDDSIMVIEGDENTQLDSWMYEGKNNGLKRVSEVFRNEDCYGEIRLNKIYRSKLASIAERM